MNQTEMLHHMCHEVLAEADIRAICKNRGLPTQAASSRPLLENLFLSDAGVAALGWGGMPGSSNLPGSTSPVEYSDFVPRPR